MPARRGVPANGGLAAATLLLLATGAGSAAGAAGERCGDLGKLWQAWTPGNGEGEVVTEPANDGSGAPNTVPVYMDHSLKEDLSKNRRERYRSMARDPAPTLDTPRPPARMAVLRGATVHANGVIELGGGGGTGCRKWVSNGGCFFANTKAAPPPVRATAEHDVVVTVAVGAHGAAVFHWVVECMSAVHQAVAARGATGWVLHVSERTPFVDAWIAVVLPELGPGRVVTGTARAKRLYVPQLGCGKPSSTAAVLWLRSRVRRALGHGAKGGDAEGAGLAGGGAAAGGAARPLLVTRTKSRSVAGWGKVAAALEAAHGRAAGGPGVAEFSDANAMPSVREQLSLFASPLVVAPHGAGLINLLAAPEGACVVEIHPKGWYDINTCYLELSYAFGLRYFGFAEKAMDDRFVDRMVRMTKPCVPQR